MTSRKMTKARNRISAESEYISRHNPPDPLVLALRAMAFVQGALSYPLYESNRSHGLPIPHTDQERLHFGQGLCGDKAQVFCDLLRPLGFEARQWGFRWNDRWCCQRERTHVVPEVRWDGIWRAFEVTWGAVWLNGKGLPRGIEDVLDNGGEKTIDKVRLLGLGEIGGPDPFAYLKAPQRWLLTNADGGLA